MSKQTRAPAPTRDEALAAIDRVSEASPVARLSYELREIRNIVLNSAKSRLLPAAFDLIDRLQVNNDAFTNHEAAGVIRAYVQYVPAPAPAVETFTPADAIAENKRLQGVLAAEHPDEPHECAASGAGCSLGPHGENGETQCRYCGQAPAPVGTVLGREPLPTDPAAGDHSDDPDDGPQ